MFYKLLAGAFGTMLAAEPAQASAAPDYLHLCTTESAFGVRFGQEVTLQETDILPIPGGGFAPFTRRQAIAMRAPHVTEVIGYAELGSEERATALVAAIRAQYVAAGWQADEDDLGMTLRRPPAGRSAEDVQISMAAEYQRVTVDCMRTNLDSVARAERPPDPATRPAAPHRPALLAGNLADCDDPARRQALMADPQALVLPALEYGSAYRRYLGAMIAWWGGQLMHSGRWTEAQRGAFEGGLGALPGVMSAGLAQAAALRDVMATMNGPISEDLTSAAACRTGVARQNGLRQIVEGSEALLRALEAAYRAEAVRLGVALE
jgi:hypothetical protein